MRPEVFLRRAWQMVTNNFAHKVLSVLIALALWFIVRDERIDTTITLALDVEAAGELMVSNDQLPELTVGVRGTRVALSRLRNANLVHVVRPPNTEPGAVTVRVRPEDLELPAGVDAVSVSPSTTGVRLEARAVRKVPVKARILVADSTDYRVRKVTVSPERVRVSGPSSIVANLDEVWTEAIEVSPKGPEPVVGEYGVSLPHRQLRLESARPVSVKVELEPVPATPLASPTPAGLKGDVRVGSGTLADSR